MDEGARFAALVRELSDVAALVSENGKGPLPVEVADKLRVAVASLNAGVPSVYEAFDLQPGALLKTAVVCYAFVQRVRSFSCYSGEARFLIHASRLRPPPSNIICNRVSLFVRLFALTWFQYV